MKFSKSLLAIGLIGGVALAGMSTQALAGEAYDKMTSFQVTGTSLDLPLVPQDGAKADRVRANLATIDLPPGFNIALYALVPDARHMAIGRNLGVVWVGTRKTTLWTITDRDGDRVGEEVKEFAPALDLVVPNGVCMSPDGVLYLVESNRVLGFGAAEFFYEGPDVAVGEVVPQDQLIPVEEVSFNHGARTCRIGPDNKLYITLGQPHNVPPSHKIEKYARLGIGGIIRMSRDGTNREVIATGVRNSVGMDINPANGEVWFTDNQVDGMGDNVPAGELNRLTAVGQNFGFPWYGGGHTRTNEYAKDEPPIDIVFPEVEMDAHAADLGMMFYTGKMFPAKYRGGIFSAQHGSWNRTVPVGARVMFTSLAEDGSAAGTEVFASGWLDQETGVYSGRPVDVAQLQDGSILVSDDLVGAVYRISYDGM